ncbi:MAG TPA: deoxyguanosinetriphosphate triphosphohydrolase [Nocardioidaceae bacterium]|nr:deoxyguanosinetriphosphate triphosphohydrolase [Nocardioidaceae bacterium]
MGYDESAMQRWASEPAKRVGRGPFERDHARLVHSASLRRLGAKTQVVGPGSDDFVRNRLTHSLEVAQIGRELARSLGCDPDVVETACLAHDLGHPPFGHNGERALNDVAAPVGGFEGNAQTLRILTRLEPKAAHADGPLAGCSAGLNLTRASLDATAKYPWTAEHARPPAGAHADGSQRRVRKFGVYADDAEVFAWMRAGAPDEIGERTCVEAQVMDLADDIAYSVHDVEDGVAAGRVDLSLLDQETEREQVFAAVAEWYLPDVSTDRLDAAVDRLRAGVAWPSAGYDGSRLAQAQLKNLTSDLIGRFCSVVEEATRARHGSGPLTRYDADLEVPVGTSEEIAVLKGIAAHYIMRTDERVQLLECQRTMLADLTEHLSAHPEHLESAFRADHALAPDDAGRLRVVVDQVAALTDASATTWHQHL